jgi:hypothetical protein
MGNLIYSMTRFLLCIRARLGPPESGGSPLLQQGELDFSPAEKRLISQGWALALAFRGQR